ncbi:MAG TPA: 3-phosphoshikimate 1-carboxyvinyltransferase [Chthoniobacteraceae bacterium]|jgi:3-phosphoshikimate 1-carboxyvinyltransferase
MTDWKIRRAPPIQTELEVPGDKSISHRSVILSSMSNGTCVIKGFLPSDDCLCTVAAMRALGVEIETPEETTLVVHGRKHDFIAPKHDIDCGNSGTTMRLLAGFLAGQPFRSRLVGDASLSKRPMARVIKPLTEMGARITAEGPGDRPPLVIEGGNLKPIHYFSPVASAQVKSAVLLAGMFAKGKTSVTEPTQSRDHTERMLEYFLVHPKKNELTVSIFGDIIPESREIVQVPGDISSAAFWLVAAAAQPRSHLLVTNVGLNKTRTGIFDILVRMGAQIRENEQNKEAEPIGNIEIKGAAPLRGTEIKGAVIPNVIDELPILAVAGALAQGRTVIADAAELRVKETDRLAAIATNLQLMGAQVTETEDGLEILGGAPLHGAHLKSFGDHRIAMAFAIAGLFAEGETTISDTACVNTSYPGFDKTLERIMHEPRQPQIPVISKLPSHTP